MDTTLSDGSTDYSVEFKNMYVKEDKAYYTP